MFKELWRSGPIGHVVADILMALSIMVSAYLLFIAYRKFVTYIGLGKIRKTTVNYAVLYDLKSPYAKGDIQLGFELKEETKILLQIIDKNDQIVTVLKEETFQEGIHPVYFNTNTIANGEYFYQLITPYQKLTKKFFIVN
ncbi:MAG: hypothetical protein N4A35_03315 [Flavobacteriales bacterium]|jgi:hypothetical protein|nr:hypothetical protein [Flavobacteriales bacterium]